MGFSARSAGRLTRAALCGLLAAAALPAAAGADLVSVPEVPAAAVPAPVPVPVPTTVEAPVIAVPSPAVTVSKAGAGAPAASPSKVVEARASVAAKRSKNGRTAVRADTRVRVKRAASASASASGSFLAETVILPISTLLNHPCTVEPMLLEGEARLVLGTTYTYTSIHATGVGLITGARYTSLATTHLHANPVTTVSDRFVRSGETGSPDDFYAMFQLPSMEARAECR